MAGARWNGGRHGDHAPFAEFCDIRCRHVDLQRMRVQRALSSVGEAAIVQVPISLSIADIRIMLSLSFSWAGPTR